MANTNQPDPGVQTAQLKSYCFPDAAQGRGVVVEAKNREEAIKEFEKLKPTLTKESYKKNMKERFEADIAKRKADKKEKEGKTKSKADKAEKTK